MEELKQMMLAGFNQLNTRIGGIEKDVADMKERQLSMETAISSMDKNLGAVEQKQTAMGEQLVRMEQKLDNNLGALYDFREIVSDKLIDSASALNRIEMRLDKAELRALQGSLLANRITIR